MCIRDSVHVETSTVRKRVGEKDITLSFEDSALDFLIEKGFNKEMGARPLRRAIEKYVEDELSELLLRGKLAGSTEVIASHKEGDEMLSFEAIKDSEVREEITVS